MDNKKIGLSKRAFIMAVEAIRAEDAIADKIYEVTGRGVEINCDFPCHKAIESMLVELMHCTKDELSLWLYELKGPDGVSWYKDGKIISLDLRDLDVLYGYLVSRLDPDWPDCDPWPEEELSDSNIIVLPFTDEDEEEEEEEEEEE